MPGDLPILIYGSAIKIRSNSLKTKTRALL
jgi:hypothetical protein